MNNNKLIAEFMELPTEVSKAGLLNYYHREYNIGTWYEVGTWYEEHELSYNVSWDWLMPVVEKIEQVNEGVPHQLLWLDLFSPIDEVYQAVIEFIESYE